MIEQRNTSFKKNNNAEGWEVIKQDVLYMLQLSPVLKDKIIQYLESSIAKMEKREQNNLSAEQNKLSEEQEKSSEEQKQPSEEQEKSSAEQKQPSEEQNKLSADLNKTSSTEKSSFIKNHENVLQQVQNYFHLDSVRKHMQDIAEVLPHEPDISTIPQTSLKK
jgi:hypothetical protein